MQVTYQAKVNDRAPYPYFDAMGEYFGRLERKLYVDQYIRGAPLNDLKKRYIKEHRITARQFNSLENSLSGKIKSLKEIQKYQEHDLLGRIASTEKAIKKKEKERDKIAKSLKKLRPRTEKRQKKIDKLKKIKFFLHHKKRRLRNLRQRLENLRKDTAQGRVRICFGTRRLFKAQHNLAANGFQNHQEWLTAWRKARSSGFFILGSKDESCGNQTCVYSRDNTMRIRVADKFTKRFGKYIKLTNIVFPYGQEHLDRARTVGRTVKGRKEYNAAISYRFIRKGDIWYVHATVEREDPVPTTSKWLGAVGIDLNDGFLQVGDVDRFGNFLNEFKIPAPMRDRSKDRIKAALGEAVKKAVLYAKEKGKPIAIEDLDFAKKKQALRESGAKRARVLSGLTYRQFRVMVESCTFREGVELLKPDGENVDPFATSIIGQLKLMARYGLPSHGSAACVIARRGLGFKLEKAVKSSVLELPERKRTSRRNYWLRVSNNLKKTHFSDRIALLYADRF
ncbi:MAG: IS200/IS605 family accessory protein TnpB-related protein [Desulfotomaculales bacterium]